MTTHKVNTQFKGGMAFHADINGHIVKMDTTEEDGGQNSGASPKRMLLASLAGCSGIDIVSILNKMKVNFSDFSIQTDAHLTEEHPKIYDSIKITYSIKVDSVDQSKMEKAVSLSMEKYCGVSAMFKHFAQFDVEINWIN